MSRYAEGTTVEPETSRMEIEKTLRRYGADQFVSGWDSTRAVIGFTADARQVRFLLEMPRVEEMPKVDGRGSALTSDQRMKRLAAEERRRWRALALVVKAKLEVVESGIATFEQEFLAHIVMPDGRTVGEHVAPGVEQAYTNGLMPPLLALGAGDPDDDDMIDAEVVA